MKKAIALLIVLIILVGSFASCAKKSSSAGNSQGAGKEDQGILTTANSGTGLTNSTTANPNIISNCTITAVVGGEAQSLDPAINQTADGATYIVHLFEGLMKVSKDLTYVPGIAAAAPKISSDKLTYTFTIRNDAKWSDGKAVTASDFVYSWQRAVNPATASAYAYQLFYIKNATEINSQLLGSDNKPVKVKCISGKPAKFKYDSDKKAFLKDAKGNYIPDEGGQYVPDPSGKYVAQKSNGSPVWLGDLGAVARDSHTLVVTLAAPCGYFDQIVAFPTLFPVRKDIVEKNPDNWFMNAKTCISNGPYVLKEWKHKSYITMTKSKTYYGASGITAANLKFLLIDDNNAALAAYKTGSIMVDQQIFPSEETPKLVKSGDCKIFPANGTYYYAFNTQKAPFNNVKVRQALSLAIDRKYIVDNIAKGGQTPAGAFVPFGMQDAATGSDFRKIGGDFINPSASAYNSNVAKAKQLMKEAGYANGKGFPKFELKYNTNTAHQKIAEYIIAQWKQNLGITATLVAEDFPTLVADRNNGNYSVSRDGWLGDYNDAMTFLDLSTKDSGNNDTHYNNPQYDALIKTAKNSNNPATRIKAMHDAEKLLMNDAAVMPIYYYTTPVLVNKKVSGVVDSPLGYLYLMWATVSK